MKVVHVRQTEFDMPTRKRFRVSPWLTRRSVVEIAFYEGLMLNKASVRDAIRSAHRLRRQDPPGDKVVVSSLFEHSSQQASSLGLGRTVPFHEHHRSVRPLFCQGSSAIWS